nr:toprim domain-containing protein [Geobacteraceae bacterium]
RKPKASATITKVVEKSPIMRYLTEERKLSVEAIAAYRVAEASEIGPWEGWQRQETARGPWIVFPSFRGKDLIAVKYLHMNRRNGKKITMVEPGCEPCLFGWQAIPENARAVVICEGEIDALTWWTYGFPALSVPFGGGNGNKQQWIDHEYPHLERIETVYLSFDNDEAGCKGEEEVVNRLGAHRCKIVRLPHKDINECLQKDVPAEEIRKRIETAESLDPGELKAPSSFRKAVIEEFFPVGGELPGFNLPWPMKGRPVRFLRGEVTVWTGRNGHGKSLVLNQVAISAMGQGDQVCIASFEMHPRKTLSRIIRQGLGKGEPTREEIDTAFSWFDGKLWIFDLLGTAKVDRMLEVFRYAYQRYGVQQFVIDSLLKCGIDSDDYTGQKAFLDILNDFANTTNAHVHLIAHSRKDENEFSPPGKLDVKGSGDITDLASNVWSVWRNKVKEEDLAKLDAGEPVKLSRSEIEGKPDALLMCVKARDDRGEEGKVGLFFHKTSLQYLERRHNSPTRYVLMDETAADDDIDINVEVVNDAC